jgi:uncharacterized membrane protein
LGAILDSLQIRKTLVRCGTLVRKLKDILRYLLAAFFGLAGFNHFINPAFYLKIMPPYLPWHLPLVYLSGFLEITWEYCF